MLNTEYKFRPCDCCSIPDISIQLEAKIFSYGCSDLCGIANNITESTTTVGGPCPYTGRTTVNVPVDPCKFYKSITRTDDYTGVLFTDFEGNCINLFPSLVNSFIVEYTCNQPSNSGVCSFSPTIGECTSEETPLSGGGYPGQPRDIDFLYNNLIQNCNYVLFDPNNLGYSSINSTPTASSFFSKNGNSKNKTRSIVQKIKHNPSPTCYLKYWIRGLRRNYITNPESTLCSGPFIRIDEEPSPDLEYQYEWNGVGTPCLLNPNKIWNNVDNIIEKDVEWEFFVPDAGASLGIDLFFESKYSFVKNYEPAWPSEEKICLPNRYPLC